MRLAVFVLAGLLAGLSGWLYAHMQRFVNPTPFDIRPRHRASCSWRWSAAPARSPAPWSARRIVVLLKNVLQDVLPAVTRYSAQLEVVLFGVLLVIILQKARGGVVPMIRALPAAAGADRRRSTRRRLARRADPASPIAPCCGSKAPPSASARWRPSTR